MLKIHSNYGQKTCNQKLKFMSSGWDTKISKLSISHFWPEVFAFENAISLFVCFLCSLKLEGGGGHSSFLKSLIDLKWPNLHFLSNFHWSSSLSLCWVEGLLVRLCISILYSALISLKGHGNEADFQGFLPKLGPHRSLILPFEPFRFWLRIRGDIRNRKTTPRLAESGSRRLNV